MLLEIFRLFSVPMFPYTLVQLLRLLKCIEIRDRLQILLLILSELMK